MKEEAAKFLFLKPFGGLSSKEISKIRIKLGKFRNSPFCYCSDAKQMLFIGRETKNRWTFYLKVGRSRESTGYWKKKHESTQSFPKTHFVTLFLRFRLRSGPTSPMTKQNKWERSEYTIEWEHRPCKENIFHTERRKETEQIIDKSQTYVCVQWLLQYEQ